MKFWVGITDKEWFQFLSQLQPDELNFWQPGGGNAFRLAGAESEGVGRQGTGVLAVGVEGYPAKPIPLERHLLAGTTSPLQRGVIQDPARIVLPPDRNGRQTQEFLWVQ